MEDGNYKVEAKISVGDMIDQREVIMGMRQERIKDDGEK
jgi:hypothetical protein